MITPIKKENATDQIYMQLLDMIFTGSWSAGSKIPSEAELSKQFGVSRVPVREALQRLNAMGIITSQQGRGAFVNAAPSSDILRIPHAGGTLLCQIYGSQWHGGFFSESPPILSQPRRTRLQ